MSWKDWLICENPLGNETWMFRTKAPAFLGRLYDEDEAPVAGLTMALNNGQILAEIVWYDEPVTSSKTLSQLAGEASKAIDTYDGVLAVDRRNAMRTEIAESGMSIPQVARAAEVNQQTIYNYLAGRADMTVGLYDRVMSVL